MRVIRTRPRSGNTPGITICATAFAVLGLMLGAARVDATVVLLRFPQISFSNKTSKKLAAAVHAVVQKEQFAFLGGGQGFGWGEANDHTDLVYGGDTTALTEFLVKLNRIEGLKVEVRLVDSLSQSFIPEDRDLAVVGDDVKPRAKPVPSWQLEYVHKRPDRVTVAINRAAKKINIDRLLEELARPRDVLREDLLPPNPDSDKLPQGERKDLAVRLQIGEIKVLITKWEQIKEVKIENPKVAAIREWVATRDGLAVRITATAPGRTILVIVPAKANEQRLEILVAN